MVSGKAKIWHSGKLNDAMRSTMSIPGIFAPVRTQGMVLVDGGVRNNFPADLAREMGADYIIGIEISDERVAYEDINNIGNIFSEFTRFGKCGQTLRRPDGQERQRNFAVEPHGQF